jgi:hypothetical protein
MNRKLYPNVPVANAVAAAFLLSKGITGSVEFVRTIFNASTGEDVADMFKCGDYWVKTDTKSVLEWYKEGYTTPDGESIYGVSMDVETGDVVDYYRTRDGIIEKTGALGAVTTSCLCTYTELPQDVQALLVDFPFKGDIILYSEKPYGHIVEYTRTW